MSFVKPFTENNETTDVQNVSSTSADKEVFRKKAILMKIDGVTLRVHHMESITLSKE